MSFTLDNRTLAFAIALLGGVSAYASPCPISASLLGKTVNVGEVLRGQTLQVRGPSNNGKVAITFGNTLGFVPQECVGKVPERDRTRKVTDYVITRTAAVIYQKADRQSSKLARLDAGLRYPIMGKAQGDFYPIQIGGRKAFLDKSAVELDKGVPVLTYHHLLKDQENIRFQRTSTTTSVSAFKHQMQLIKALGYRTISLYDLEGYLQATENLPDKVVVLTFDDGLESVHRYAYPILKALKMQAVIFMITSRIKYTPQKWDPEHLQFINRKDLRKMQDVFDVQSHTHFLHRYSKLRPVIFQRNYHNIFMDLKRARQILHAFNPRADYLAYPFGAHTETARQAARDLGIRMAFTTKIGKVRFGDDPYQLKRLYLMKNDSDSYIIEKLRD
ncbi:polysaccharide deacetylase family protein [Pasteurellaceae bacterium HPA106]|uniref:polysaccharide deacetylase family protein n=1 Tax=Spirabiliibacterium pneumoniae TaxID=221400 RepID=UPI001AACA832|nr:polysaccharide deacetylase family protein [Spirabiliibacterium pneumoniae]MBE2896491.1 polysaccharide deacetylase family protein [Spirabiliibacterium pneumoniae]